jgi:hypothetical protein
MKFTYAAGTSGAYTVPSGCIVTAFWCYSTAGGSLTIAPGGAGNTETTGDSITLPAAVRFERDLRDNADRANLPQLGEGTVFTFTTTDAYYIEMAS